MDGFTSAGIAGILYAEDFGEPEPAPPPPPPPPAWEPEPDPVPTLGQADIDRACIEAVAAAERAWTEGALERRTLALEAIGAGLAEARRTAAAEAEAVADGIARAVLAMTVAVLPEMCRSHGDAEVRAMLQRLLPLVARQGGVVVRAHAGLLEDLATDLAALDEDLHGAVQFRAANLPPGDVRVSWPDGGAARDTGAVQAALRDSLSQLGLIDPAPAPVPTRSLAHVHAH